MTMSSEELDTGQPGGDVEGQDLASFFGMDAAKELYGQLKEFSSSDIKKIMQFTKISYEEIMMYSDYLLLAEEMELTWLEGVVERDLQLRKSEKGWFLGVIAGIVKAALGAVEGIGSAVGEVSSSIKEAFT